MSETSQWKRRALWLLIGLLLGLALCYFRLSAAQTKAAQDLAVAQAAADTARAQADSLSLEAARQGAIADSLREQAIGGRPTVDRAAAAAWRARERARIRDALTLVIRDSMGRDTVAVVPAEVVARFEADSLALAACLQQAGTERAALAACSEARETSDSALAVMTGAYDLQLFATEEAIRLLALERAKQGIDLGIFQLHLLPKVELGFGMVYNINCPEPEFSSSQAETRTPIEYPVGFRDFAGSRFPGWDFPTETVDRVVTERSSSGCQRFPYGPSLSANVLRLTF